MKAGVIGKIDGSPDNVEDFQREVETDIEAFDSLQQCLEVTEEISISNGRTAQIGRAAIETVVENEEIRIREGNIRNYAEPEKTTKYTNFLFVPGSFVAVSSGGGKFAFSLLSSAAGVNVNEIELDLDAYLNEHPEADPWKIGFHGSVSGAENGVLHGEHLLEDSEFGEILAMSNKNQVGLTYTFDEFDIKMYAAASGYVEIYQPSNLKTEEYVQFVESDLLHHANVL